MTINTLSTNNIVKQSRIRYSKFTVFPIIGLVNFINTTDHITYGGVNCIKGKIYLFTSKMNYHTEEADLIHLYGETKTVRNYHTVYQKSHVTRMCI